MAALRRRFWPPLRVPASACLGACFIMFYRFSRCINGSVWKMGSKKNCEIMRNGDITFRTRNRTFLQDWSWENHRNQFFLQFWGFPANLPNIQFWNKWNMVAWQRDSREFTELSIGGIQLVIYPLVMTHIAMENGPLIVDLPIGNGDFP